MAVFKRAIIFGHSIHLAAFRHQAIDDCLCNTSLVIKQQIALFRLLLTAPNQQIFISQL